MSTNEYLVLDFLAMAVIQISFWKKGVGSKPELEGIEVKSLSIQLIAYPHNSFKWMPGDKKCHEFSKSLKFSFVN